MSFQAYLDKVEELTGKTPNDFVAMAKAKDLTEHKDILAWLKSEYGLGLGHARAMAYVIQHGPKFTVRQTTGPHRDEADTLILTGRRSSTTRRAAAKKNAPKAAARKTGAKKTGAKKTGAKKVATRRTRTTSA